MCQGGTPPASYFADAKKRVPVDIKPDGLSDNITVNTYDVLPYSTALSQVGSKPIEEALASMTLTMLELIFSSNKLTITSGLLYDFNVRSIPF